MLWGASEQSDFLGRIDRWKQEVVKNTLQLATQGRSQKYEAHHMKLRSRNTRPALAEVSGNLSSRKRKASAMADAPPRKYGKKAVMDENAEGVARRPRRGRPPKTQQHDTQAGMEQSASRPRGLSANNAELANSREPSLPIRTELTPSIWSPSRPASPRKAGTSPSKRGQITLDKPMSEAAIDMDYLSRCDPAVHLITFRELKLEGIGIPSPVDDLFRKLQGVPLGVIPRALKVSSSSSQRWRDRNLLTPAQLVYEEDANTPRKSKEPHSDSYYLEPEKTPFPRHCLDRMKSTADLVLGKALRAQSENAHERQWGGLVNQLLCEVEAWQKWPGQVVVLNVYDFALWNSSSGVANKIPVVSRAVFNP